MSELILIRGPMGAGKTTLANRLNPCGDIPHYEADMFFVDLKTKEYKWDGAKIKKAHEWCFMMTEQALEAGFDVIVSNTFITMKELHPYLELGAKYNATIQEIICWGRFQNIHGLPDDVVEAKRQKFELNR